jgi:glycosyltransferase involved in cell wall biosynthesis
MKLSVAALDVCREQGIPTIVTLSDFWFLCARTNLLTWDGKLCSGPRGFTNCMKCVSDLHGVSENLANTITVLKRAGRLKRSLLRANRIIALTEFQKKVFVDCGYPAARIEVLEHGPEAECLLLESASGREIQGKPSLVIGIVGSLVKHKGVHILAQALKELPQLNVEIQVWGPIRECDPYVVELQEFAGADHRFVLRGGFEPHQLGKIISQFDILAMPALWHENGPLVVKAAMAQGVPVLASKVGSLSEMIKDGKNGWLVPAGDVGAWARSISHLSATPPKIFPLQAIKTAEQNADEFLCLYKELTTRG